jgi:hypothetical protein
MIAAIVVPFGCRSIPSTVSCLDEALAGLAGAGLDGTALGAGETALRLPPEDLVDRDCLVTRFAGFDLVLLVAIWLSLMSTTASCAATDAAPPTDAGREWGPMPAAIRGRDDLEARRRPAVVRSHR